jgi:hypothetical protein
VLNRSIARSSLLAAALAGGCSLVVETDALQAGATGAGGGRVSSTSATTGGDPTTGATSTSTGATGGGGDGGAATTDASGGGGDGGAGTSGGGGASAGGGGSGGGPTWCELNAPVDAFLCADFDTSTTGLSSPPWDSDAFESRDGIITLEEGTFRSAPASARIRLADAQEPSCGYQVLEADVPGAPERAQVRFAIQAEDTSGVGDDALVALVSWDGGAGLVCSLILGLAVDRGFLIEQTWDGDVVTTVGQDQFPSPSFFEGWHDVALSIDLAAGSAAVAYDGSDGEFVEADDDAVALSATCIGAPVAGSMRVRIGPHCETPPLIVHVDDVVIAPF